MKTPKSEVYNCDCMDYMRSLPDKAFSLAVVDPPYGNAGGGSFRGGQRFGGRFNKYKPIIDLEGGLTDTNPKTKRVEIIPKLGQIEWDTAPTEEYFEELFRVSENQIIWGGNYFALPPTRCFLVWDKVSISEKFSMAMAEYAWTSFFGNAKIFRAIPNSRKDDVRFHATQKPIELYSWIYKLFAKPGDTILDTHLGSGSSRIAAYRAGLDFVGCEINKDYFDKAEARFQKLCHGEIEIDGHKETQLEIF